MAITIVGLGPGSVDLLSQEAWLVLEGAQRVYFRTLKHPTIDQLPAHIERVSFDDVYDRAETIDEVFAEIVEHLINEGQSADVIYAVPGHPFISESTVTLLVDKARQAGVNVRVVAGLSYVELCISALEIDGIEGMQLFDAFDIEQQQYPSVNADYPLLVGQVHCELIASEVKFVLSRVYPETHQVCLIHGAGTAEQRLQWLALDDIDQSEHISYLTTLYIPPLSYVSTLGGLAETVAQLRGPDGEPEVQDFTAQSESQALSNAAHNAQNAIAQLDDQALCDSLADLLYQIVLQAEMSSEDGGFGLSEIIALADERLKVRYE